MATELIETLVDDLDGTRAAETVSFALDGRAYEIDLSKRNAAGLRKLLARYTQAGRSSGRRSASTRSARAKKKGRSEYDLVQLREWAAANKVDLPSRGRIPRAAVEQFLSRKK